MIKYSLKCNNCSIEFESWFGSSKEFDRLKKMNLLNCEMCGSLKVQKSLMSPNLSNTKKKSSEKNNLKFKEVKRKIKDYQKFIKKNELAKLRNVRFFKSSKIINGTKLIKYKKKIFRKEQSQI